MNKITRNDTALVVIDMQEKLVRAMDEEMLETVVNNVAVLAASLQLMGVPVIETVQNPKGLGNTISDLEELSPALRIEKNEFSICKRPEFGKFLQDKGIKNVILTGMEAHICVLLTAMDLVDAGYNVYIVADAVISRNDFNWETGLDMAQKSGASVTVTETVLYALLGSSEAPEFKDILKLVR